MVTAKEIASYFIAKANAQGSESAELSGNNDLTNLKLQKILYFAQVEHLQEKGAPLFDDEIQAWQYGPVVKEVYDWLKGCGAYVITEFDVELADTSKISEETKSFLNKIWDKYSRYSAWGLVEKTHKEGSAWDLVYDDGKGAKNAISHNLLKQAETLE